MNATQNIVIKQLPQFSLARCKRCGICLHFCAMEAIAARDSGMPYLAKAEACTSCGLCRDMCPDWAVSLEPTPMETAEESEPAGQEAGADETSGEEPAPLEPKASDSAVVAGARADG